MRVVLFAAVVAAGVLYARGAAYFFFHERTAESIEWASALPPGEIAHPEAMLSVARMRMSDDDYSAPVGALVERTLAELPAFYLPHSFLAAYYSSRLEQPERVREGFENALARFPASGVLHLDYGRWLLMAPSTTSGAIEKTSLAETHVRRSLELEPELTPAALEALERYGVSAERWAAFVPDDRVALRGMVLALVRSGHRGEALVELRRLLEDESEPRYQRQAAQWALMWNDPALALDAARKLEARSAPGVEPHQRALYETLAYLRLGESDMAYEVFRAALTQLGPSTSPGLKLLCGVGEEYARLSRPVLAESIFMEATSYSPSYVCALVGLGRVKQRQGDVPGAIAYYERVLDLDPQNETAKKELLRIMSAR